MSWWLATAVSTARISGKPDLGTRRRISGTRQRPVSRNPRSRKHATQEPPGSGLAANPLDANEARTAAGSARPGSGIRRDPAA